MTIFAGRSTIHRLHQKVHRNLLKTHQARYESTKPNTTTIPPPPPPPPPQQRTIPGPTWAWIDPLMRPFRAYAGMQRRSPLMTQWESALVIYYLGDLSSQLVMTNAFLDAQYEPIRGLRAMIIGSITAIPSYKWFLFLGNNFNYSSHILSLTVKVCVNQTFFTPLFNTYFFGMQTLLSGGSWADAKERVINTVPVSWKNSWKLWPAVTAFSFTFVPWQYRSVFAGVIAIGWQTYLSWLNRTDENRQVLEHIMEKDVEQQVVRSGKEEKKKKKAEKKADEEKTTSKKKRRKDMEAVKEGG